MKNKIGVFVTEDSLQRAVQNARLTFRQVDFTEPRGADLEAYSGRFIRAVYEELLKEDNVS